MYPIFKFFVVAIIVEFHRAQLQKNEIIENEYVFDTFDESFWRYQGKGFSEDGNYYLYKIFYFFDIIHIVHSEWDTWTNYSIILFLVDCENKAFWCRFLMDCRSNRVKSLCPKKCNVCPTGKWIKPLTIFHLGFFILSD